MRNHDSKGKIPPRVHALSDLKRVSPSNAVHGINERFVFVEKQSFGRIPKIEQIVMEAK